MASITTAERITLARNGSIPIDINRLLNDSNDADTALIDLFALTWAVLITNGTIGKANEVIALGTEVFGEEMEKAIDAYVEEDNPGMSAEERTAIKNGHKKMRGPCGTDTAVVKLAALFWFLVGAKHMGQAEAVRVMGEEVQHEGGVQFEEMVTILGKMFVD